MFKPVATDDPNIDDYWREKILYVKNTGQHDKCYEVDETQDRKVGQSSMNPSTYRVGSYEYALLLED